MTKSRKMTLAAAALVSGALLYVARRRKKQPEDQHMDLVKKTRHLNPAFSKMKDRHRNIET